MAHEHDGSNGFDPDQLRTYLAEIDKADDELIDLKVSHMTACKVPRAKIRAVMKEAREGGMNMEALRAKIFEHRQQRKIDDRIAELEADDLADFEAMKRALGDYGDTALGAAALKRAAPKGEKLDTLRS